MRLRIHAVHADDPHMRICASRCACKNLDAHQPHIEQKMTEIKEYFIDNCRFTKSCKMPFASQTKIKKEGEKRHRCPMCASSFTTAGNLKQHVLVHTGEKPFSCNQCEYKCARKSDLKKHLLTHSGEKPFTCMQCEFSCTTAGILKQHTLKHRGEKPLSCDQCNYKCT